LLRYSIYKIDKNNNTFSQSCKSEGMKRGYHELLPEEQEEMLWVMSIAPGDNMQSAIRDHVMDDLAETLWEYSHFFPEINPEFFSLSYSHSTSHPIFKPYVIYILTNKDYIPSFIYYCQERVNIFRNKYGDLVDVRISNPRRAAPRDISLFSKT